MNGNGMVHAVVLSDRSLQNFVLYFFVSFISILSLSPGLRHVDNIFVEAWVVA